MCIFRAERLWINSFLWDRLELNVISLAQLVLVMALLPGVARMGFCRGGRIMPQLTDGPGWITRFDLVNGSARVISNMTAQSGLCRQPIRVEASGNSSTAVAGYAITYDEEPGNPIYSEDYVPGISV